MKMFRVFFALALSMLFVSCGDKEEGGNGVNNVRPSDIIVASKTNYVDEHQPAIVKTATAGSSISDIRMTVTDISANRAAGDYEMKAVQRYSEITVVESKEIGGLENGFELHITPRVIKDFEFDVELVHEYSDGEIITQSKTVVIKSRDVPSIGFSNTLPSSVLCATEVDFKLNISGGAQFMSFADLVFSKNSGVINGNSTRVSLKPGDNDLKLLLYDEGDFEFDIVVKAIDGTERTYPISGTATKPSSTMTVSYDDASLPVYSEYANLDCTVYSSLIPQIPTWKIEITKKPAGVLDSAFAIDYSKITSKSGSSTNLISISRGHAINEVVTFKNQLHSYSSQWTRFQIRHDSSLKAGDEITAVLTLYDKYGNAHVSKELNYTVR